MSGMKRPEEVIIGSYRLPIEYPDMVITDEHDVLYGEYRSFDRKILVSKNAHIDAQRETVLHETLHAIDDRYNFDSLEERSVTQLSHGLYDWMRRNPDVVRWIIADDESEAEP